MLEEKLKELGIEIPQVPQPLASYVPAVKSGNLIFTAGQVPMKNGQLVFKGKVGTDLSLSQATEAAKLCILNGLGAVKSEIGDLNKIKKIVKVVVFVNSAEGFRDQPKVANGASDLLVQLFGENGKHARSAIGVKELPIDAAVEIELIVEI